MDKKEETFMRYGKTFQEKLCQLMIEDRSFCDQMEEVLSLEFFELAYLRAMTEIVLTYREERGIHPKYDLLEMKIKGDLDSYDRSVQTQIREFYARVLASQGEISDAGWVKDKAIDFCRKKVLKKAMMESVGLIKTSSFDNNFGHDWMKDVEDRFVVRSRKPISTGWPRVDDITKGGFGSRELGVVIAPTGAGKSMILVHLGSEALNLGKNVVHYTLELADTVVGQRYDSCITEVPLQDLNYSKEIVID